MISHPAILLVALVALAKSADILVEYATRVARRFQVSDLLVGLVVTSVGTSLPELSSSLSAAFLGSSALVIGGVVGSNIANIGLVLGVAAIVRPFTTQVKMHDRDGFVLVASTVLLFAAALDNRLGRVDGAVFLLIYLVYVVFVARSDRDGVEHRFRDFLKFMFDFEYAAPVVKRLTRRRTRPTAREMKSEPQPRALIAELAALVTSLGVLILSARFVVAESIWIADLLQIPENLIGLSLVAIGTSLPELMIGVVAARAGRSALVVGNVIGSNIANGLLIVGLAATVRPLDVPEFSVVYTIPVMLFFTLALLHFIRSDWQITRRQGVVAVVAYAMFLATALIRGRG